MQETMPPITAVYLIVSADIRGSESDIDSMDPTRSTGTYPVETFPELAQTEGDDQYDFGYLGDEIDDPSYYQAGAFDSEGSETVETISEDDQRIDSTEYGEGRHRKWAGELTPERWRAFADRYCIDLEDSGMPVQYEDTLGSITEYGHIPAVAVSMHEGWSPTRVIDMQAYVSFATAEPTKRGDE